MSTAIQLGGLQLVATTGPAGFALVNGTPTFLTWTAPNDGQMHRALVFGTMQVTVTEVGGTIQQTYTDPGGTAIFSQVIAGGLAAGAAQLTAKLVTVQAGSVFGLRQSAALTGGAATLWAEIWAL